MNKKCCKSCKNGKKCESKAPKASKAKQSAWLQVYRQGMGADKIPFRGLGAPRAKPKGCKSTEYHARTLTGKKHNFAGAGTCFDQRRARGDKGISYADHCAKLHDYWYSQKDATRDQIKRADDDFRRCVKAAPNVRVGDGINRRIMTTVFKGKRALEKVGLNPLRGTDSKKKGL